jgi:hypothetical protein
MAREQTVWFAMIDGREAGPMTRAEFALRLATDLVDEETYVWKDGMREWLPAAQVRDLEPLFQSREQGKRSGARPPPPPAAAKAKTKRREVDAGGGMRAEVDVEEVLLELDLPVGPAHRTPSAPPPVLTTPPPARTEPPAAHVQAEQPAPEPPAEKEQDWADRTVMEMIPLGERVHQEEVAGDLFAPGDAPPPSSGKTGKFALDSLKWSYAKVPRKESKAEASNAVALLKAMQATAAKPAAAPSEGLPLALPRQPAGARRPSPRRPPSVNPVAIVWGVVGFVLLLGFTIFLLVRWLL